MWQTMVIGGVSAWLAAAPVQGQQAQPMQPAGPTSAQQAMRAPQPLVQVALLLDTSGSMEGLIDQARSQLWKIVNELAAARHRGQAPLLQVALYEYGKSSISASEQHLRQIVGFTTDLDKVSQELFALRTNGGDEYCGAVIAAATNGLTWSSGRDDLKMIFIAGNEPFTQGSVDYRESCRAAIARGIVVNTIHCGPYEEGLRTDWKAGATLADGSYSHIDHNRQVVHIPAPQDEEIQRLGVELNTTYIPLGTAGREGLANQAAQDRNAAAASGGSFLARSVTKSTSNYRNQWDLVDAVQSQNLKVSEVKEQDLPEAMRTMNSDQRQQYVQEQATKRQQLQQRIRELNAQRQAYVEQKQREQAQGQQRPMTLDEAVIQAVRTQAQSKGYEFQDQ